MYVAIALGLLTVGAGSFVFGLVMQWCARRVMVRRTGEGPTPPISVLKPLKGADDDLFDNLATLAQQDYPDFELVLGCEDAMDPALSVARRLARAYPDVHITIVAGGKSIGHNPKVNNLAELMRSAKHDWVLVSDADVRARPGYLRAMASETRDARVGLVSSVIVGSGERALGAIFDTLHMNGFILSTVCAADVMADHPCVVGKSMLFRRSDLARLGGLGIVKDVLAEDYLLGRTYKRAGFRVALSGYGISAIAGARSFRAFFGRHVRWSQMRRHIARYHYVGEPLLLPTPWFFAAALFALSSAHVSGHAAAIVAAAAAAGLVGKCAADSALTKFVRGRPLDVSDASLIPAKDLVILVAWVLGWLRTTVEWRGNVFRIGANSILTPLGNESPATAASREAL